MVGKEWLQDIQWMVFAWNEHGIPVPLLPLAWLSRVFVKGQKDRVDTRGAVCKNAGKKEGDLRCRVRADGVLGA